LGQVDTAAGQIVGFPNSHIHRVQQKAHTHKEGRRIIAVFWLVDPTVRIKSTADVEKQQTKWSIKERDFHMEELMKERSLHKQSFNVRDLNLCEH